MEIQEREGAMASSFRDDLGKMEMGKMEKVR
jgi:hypothetical protein